MKPSFSLFYSRVFILLASLVTIGALYAKPPETYSIIYSKLYSQFFYKSSAWLVKLNSRQMIYSSDNGVSWHTPNSKYTIQNNFGSICFIDEYHGWTLGCNGVWETYDKGLHWKSVSAFRGFEASRLCRGQIQFIDEKHGWIVIPANRVFKTMDGGNVWQECILPWEAHVSELSKLFFLDTKNGWIGGSRGLILKTTDGGYKWSSVKIDSPGSVTSLRFTDELFGWSIVGNSVYTTDNGGEKWIPKLIAEEAFESSINLSCFFVNNQVGWVAGHSNMWAGKASSPLPIKGVLLFTDDGGSHWRSKINTSIQEDVFSLIEFVDNKKGWLISRDNVYKTKDGGVTWEKALTLAE
jgi:photosystem II stability/assembly factor-like uncharacterized protein